MSITWNIEITNVQVVSKRADVTATRTDSADPTAPQVYSFAQTPIGTANERAVLLNTIKAEVAARAGKDAQIVAVVTDLEQTGKTALETWETTR